MTRILLIEDDTILRENTAELLELNDYNVSTASDGKQGVTAARDQLPDLIICDIMMPELDGFGVLEALSKEPTTHSIPFIFLSAKTERQDVRKGMEMGADDYLTKPFEEAELIGAIESRLARASLLREMGREAAPMETDPEQPRNIHELKNLLDDRGEELTFASGEEIYRQGDHSNRVYLVLSGAVKTHLLDDHGKELITGIYHPDDFFGLVSFSKNVTYPHSATTLEPTKLVSLSKEEVRTVLSNNPDLALEFMQFLSDHLTDARDQLLQMAYGSVRRKTAATLLRFAEKLPGGTGEPMHVLRSDLASVAGIATETLIRTLSQFKEEGLIEVDQRNIRLLDIPALKRC